MVVTKIIKVESTFDSIYRITTEDGLVLDVMTEEPPRMESMFEYTVNDPRTDDGVIMNGTVYIKGESKTYVSFGGLICIIPFLISSSACTLWYRESSLLGK